MAEGLTGGDVRLLLSLYELPADEYRGLSDSEQRCARRLSKRGLVERWTRKSTFPPQCTLWALTVAGRLVVAALKVGVR